jgi:hypothetical protein
MKGCSPGAATASGVSICVTGSRAAGLVLGERREGIEE